MQKILKKITQKIDKGEEISPFLFIDKNSEILNEKVKNLALEILKYYEIPKQFLYILENKNQNIKISEVKNFIENAGKKSGFKVQIFLFENIWNMTLQATNSLLKFFEEPWNQNIIFLTNQNENNILETILSRVQTINFFSKNKENTNIFFQDLIKNYLSWQNELLSYFFKNKIEKEEYINFLENLIIFSKKNLVFIDFLDEILEDINAIKQNNVNSKFVVDKWILKIWE